MIGNIQMNKLIVAGIVALFATSANADWKSSCGSNYDRNGDNFSFTVEKDSIGGCPSDKKSYQYVRYSITHSERSEVKSSRDLTPGVYLWSADIVIDRACEQPAQRNTLFQVHDGRSSGAPPSWFGINEYNSFRTHDQNYSIKPVPEKNKFNLESKITFKDKRIDVDYFVDGELVASTTGFQKGDQMYLKFGVYRVNSKCTITQTYNNVTIRKVE